MNALFMILLLLMALVLIVLVLIQRGKGGGLAGAFGGLGGQSAFGTKAGDTFTRITIGVAAVWIVLCLVSVRMMGTTVSPLNLPPRSTESPAPADQPGGSATSAPSDAGGNQTGSSQPSPRP
jgi:preprotein translocase subunit SecG